MFAPSCVGSGLPVPRRRTLAPPIVGSAPPSWLRGESNAGSRGTGGPSLRCFPGALVVNLCHGARRLKTYGTNACRVGRDNREMLTVPGRARGP
jgi:hypothetical protein